MKNDPVTLRQERDEARTSITFLVNLLTSIFIDCDEQARTDAENLVWRIDNEAEFLAGQCQSAEGVAWRMAVPCLEITNNPVEYGVQVEAPVYCGRPAGHSGDCDEPKDNPLDGEGSDLD